MTDTWQRRLARCLAERGHSPELQHELGELLSRVAVERRDAIRVTGLDASEASVRRGGRYRSQGCRGE